MNCYCSANGRSWFLKDAFHPRVKNEHGEEVDDGWTVVGTLAIDTGVIGAGSTGFMINLRNMDTWSFIADNEAFETMAKEYANQMKKPSRPDYDLFNNMMERMFQDFRDGNEWKQ